MKPIAAFGSALLGMRHLVHQCAVVLAERGLDQDLDALAVTARRVGQELGAVEPVARLALDSAIARLVPAEPPPRPVGARPSNLADHQRHGPAPGSCLDCGWSTWWMGGARADRWLCARCWVPASGVSIVWHEASDTVIEEALREPRWSASPDEDDYLFLRIRQVARDAARTAADLLGAWRPATPRAGADLRTIDWHSITDAAAIIAAAEELRAWSVENAPAARAIARRALGEVLGWPAVAVPPVLDRALDLLRVASEEAIAALAARWPAGHEPGSPTPIPLRVDEATEVLVPAHPHLVLLLLGVRPRTREGATASAKVGATLHANKSPAELGSVESTNAAPVDSKPPATCHSCRGQRFFRLDAPWSPWTCATCHPPIVAPERLLWVGRSS